VGPVGRRRTQPGQTPPLVQRIGALSILEALPAALIVADSSGTIVMRNAAGSRLAGAVVARHGAAVMEALRDKLADVVRTSRTFPVHTVVSVDAGGVTVELELTVDSLAEGFVGVWDDVTQAHRSARLTKAVAAELAASASALTDLGDDIAGGAEDVSMRAAAVAAGAEQMSASIREIAASSETASRGSADAVGAAKAANTRLAELDDSVTKISVVSQMITTIAEQTHLLALNATIEAAHAGEAGRGFAVVAAEVKELASRTRDATEEISAMVGSVQTASGAAVDSIGEILELIDDVLDRQTSVAGAVQEQASVADEMSQGVTAVASSADTSAHSVVRLRESAQFVAQKAAQLDSAFAV
jgi:methyl-accepting chemotaxis protein